MISKREADLDTIVIGFKYILDGLGIDYSADPHMRDTPMRAAADTDQVCRSRLGNALPMITDGR